MIGAQESVGSRLKREGVIRRCLKQDGGLRCANPPYADVQTSRIERQG